MRGADMPGARPRILVTIETDHLPEAQAILEEAAEVTYRPNLSHAELVETIGGYDAIVTNLQQKITKNVIDAAVKLRVIATPSTGTDHIDLAYAEERGLTVQSIKADYDVLKNITATAEHAFMLMMSCLRKLPFAFDTVVRGGGSENRSGGVRCRAASAGFWATDGWARSSRGMPTRSRWRCWPAIRTRRSPTHGFGKSTSTRFCARPRSSRSTSI
jgi:phosphoglycerate dehydrogenase-like enzyme